MSAENQTIYTDITEVKPLALVFSTFFILIGWVWLTSKLSKESKIENELRVSNEDAMESIDEFNKKLVDYDLYKSIQSAYNSSPDYKQMLDEEYDSVLSTLHGDTSALRLDQWRNAFAPVVHMAMRGKIPGASRVYPLIYVSVLDEPKIYPIYKWFDRKINTLFPEYYIVRYYDEASMVNRTVWNPFLKPTSKNIVRVSDIQFEE